MTTVQSVCLPGSSGLLLPDISLAMWTDCCSVIWAGLLAGPVIGGLLDPVQVGWLATGGLIACSIWTLLFVQESLDRKTRLEVSAFYHRAFGHA